MPGASYYCLVVERYDFHTAHVAWVLRKLQVSLALAFSGRPLFPDLVLNSGTRNLSLAVFLHPVYGHDFEICKRDHDPIHAQIS